MNEEKEGTKNQRTQPQPHQEQKERAPGRQKTGADYATLIAKNGNSELSGVQWGVLAQFLCWSLPLGIWLLLRRPGCLALMLGVWWCSVVLTSSCLMAAKAFGPVWGLYYPLHHVACVVAVLCTPTQRYSSADDPGPTRDQPQGGGRQQETGGSRQQPRKGQTQRSPTTPREAHKGQRKDTRRNAGKNTSTTKTPCSETLPGLFPTPFLHMSLHYALGCAASQPYTQPTLQIRWGGYLGAGRLQPAGAQPIVW